jgi:hypothetical protein
MNSTHDESSSAPSATDCVENVHSSAAATACTTASAISIGSSTPASFNQEHAPTPLPPSQRTRNTQHNHPRITNNKLVVPPANIANPRFGRDVATIRCRATLRTAVIHRPLLALKISTALLLLAVQRHQQSAAAAQTAPP